MATSTAEAAPPPSLLRAHPLAAAQPLPVSNASQSLPIPAEPYVFGHSESSDGFDIDVSAASNNTTTQSPPPQPAIALHPPTFQELPPLPSALQHPLSPEQPEEYEDGAMGAASKPEFVTASESASKSANLKNSIGHLKQEMKNLRNADLTLLYQLNELHQQILAYKVAMSERLERQSETNSEYSNLDFDEEDEDDFDEDDDDDDVITDGGADARVHHGLQSLAINGDAREGGLLPSHHQYPQPQPRRQLQQHASPQSPTHRIHPASSSMNAASPASPAPNSSTPRSSLQQLRQQLPPPPPRPGGGAGGGGGGAERRPQANDSSSSSSTGVHHWLDLNFQPDSYNC